MDFIKQSTSLQTRRGAALLAAALLGVLADQIVRNDGRPGLNVLIWALAGTAALWLIAHRHDLTVSCETRWLVAGAVGFACLLVLRDAAALAVFCLFAAVLLLGLAAGRAAMAWAAVAYFVDVATAAARVAALMALGPFGWSIGGAREVPTATPATGKRAWPRWARTFARGTVMALPPLLVLTALLTSADPVFERLLHNALFTGIEPLLQHIVFAGVIAWFVSGYLRAFFVSDDVAMDRVRIPRPAIAASEIAVALSLLNILFLVFLAVQARYLFGGSGIVEVTPGLSYAEYARHGFFELIAAAALVVPLLLVADWAATDDDAKRRRALRATSTLLVLLLVGILASAAYRMKLYQDAYGLTEDRVYASTFMVWLTVVLAWFAGTVLRARRQRFAIGAIVAGLACIAVLHVLNPHAMIARVNIIRAASGGEYDGRYLRTLSADAVPTLIERLPEMPVGERCSVATMLRKRWSGERRGGWRSWNISDARARNLVRDLSPPADCRRVVASSASVVS